MPGWNTRREIRSQPFAQYDETGLQKLLTEFESRMRQLNDQYLRLMGEHIADIGRLWPSDVHRLQQIRRMNRNLQQLERRIASAAERGADEIDALFQQIAQEDLRMATKILGAPDTVNVSDNPALQQILRARARETAARLSNLSNTTVVSGWYRGAIDEAVSAVQSGAEDYGSAIRRVIREAGQSGLRVAERGQRMVDYESGYYRRLDTAVRMNVLDGVRHLNQSIMEELGRQFGADGVEIDAHMLCAEDHLPYQGGQYSNEEFEEIQDSLQRPFGEWNCRHSWHPIILGVSPRTYTDGELEDMRRYSTEPVTIDGRTKTRYQWSQEMRRTETRIRQLKDTATLARYSGDDRLRGQCQQQIGILNEHYKALSRGAGLKPEYERTYVSGFRDAKGAEVLTNNTGSAKVPLSPTFFVGNSSQGKYDPDEYKASLQARYDRGTEMAKALYDKYIPTGGAVSNGNYNGTPEYDPATKTIRMSFRADAANVCGSGTTWFHEHAHLIDDASGNKAQRNSFIRAIVNDCKAYEAKIMKDYRLTTVREARQQASANMVMQGINTLGVQDIFGGVIGKPYPGAIAKHPTRYWQVNGYQGLCRETFAHMFDACFDRDKAVVMKYYLPSAWKEFESIMKEMLK